MINYLESPLLDELAPAHRCRNHRPLAWLEFPVLLVPLLLASLSLGEAAQRVKLGWDANAESNIVGYVLQYGTISGEPRQRIAVDCEKTTATVSVSGLADGTTYFFTVIARNAFGIESPPSNEVSYTTPMSSEGGVCDTAIGETNVLTTADSWNGNLLVAQRAKLERAATILSLSFYVTRASGRLRLGIFDATGPEGGPGTKIAETGEITPTVGWNEATVNAAVYAPRGTYWLAYLASDNNLAFVKQLSGQARYYRYPYGTMPERFSSSSQSEVVHWSLFANLSTLRIAFPTRALTVTDGTGNGNYTEGTRVRVSASAPASGQEFDRWTGDWQILDNPLSPTTTALMLFRDLAISASYRAKQHDPTSPVERFHREDVGWSLLKGVMSTTNSSIRRKRIRK